jgi:hypothetical protein
MYDPRAKEKPMAEPHDETHQEKETRGAALRAAQGKQQRGRRTARYRKSVRNWLLFGAIVYTVAVLAGVVLR